MSVAPMPAQARPPTTCILLPPFLSLQLECGAGREEKQKEEWLHQTVWEGGEVQNVRRCGVLSRVNCVCEDRRRFEDGMRHVRWEARKGRESADTHHLETLQVLDFRAVLASTPTEPNKSSKLMVCVCQYTKGKRKRRARRLQVSSGTVRIKDVDETSREPDWSGIRMQRWEGPDADAGG